MPAYNQHLGEAYMDSWQQPEEPTSAVVQAQSPHVIKIPNAKHPAECRYIAYPGWRFRFDEQGTAYHEKIPTLWDRIKQMLT